MTIRNFPHDWEISRLYNKIMIRIILTSFLYILNKLNEAYKRLISNEKGKIIRLISHNNEIKDDKPLLSAINFHAR